MITSRWASAADLEKLYGQTLPVTVRAQVALADGEPFAAVGLARVGERQVLFSDYLPGTRDWLRKPAALKAILAIRNAIRERRGPVVALADRYEPDSDRLMIRLGFEFVEETEDGGLYRWHS